MDSTEEPVVSIWQLIQEIVFHGKEPTPGCWEHPDDVERVRQLLQKDPGQVHALSDGTPLHEAAYYALPAIAEVLLQAGADVNAQPGGGWTPLHQAVSKSQDEDRDLRVIQVLLDHGADPNCSVGGSTPLDIAWGRAAELLREHAGKIDLNNACRLGLVEEVKRILASDPGAVLGAKNPQWLLSDAATCSQYGKEADGLEIIRLLIQHGANVNGPGTLPGTPLYCACNGAPVSVIRLLLLHGADVNAVSYNGETPLDMARKCKRDDVVEMLVRAGGH
jgi:uncharacterized protein